jgi:hypothetical protein
VPSAVKRWEMLQINCSQVDDKVARAAVAVLTERGLQAPKPFVDKVVQLHEMLRVRFGVMLLGPAGGGKSTAYRALQVTAHPCLHPCQWPWIWACSSFCSFLSWLNAQSALDIVPCYAQLNHNAQLSVLHNG